MPIKMRAVSPNVISWRRPGPLGSECLEINVPVIPLERLVCRTTKFIYVEKGGGKCRVGRNVHTVHEGDLLIIPPGEVHGGTTPAPGTILRVLITPADGPQSQFSDLSKGKTPVVSSPDIARQFRELHDAMRYGNSHLDLESRLIEFNLRLRADADTTHGKNGQFYDRGLRYLREIIADRCFENLSLLELATEGRMSPSQLCRAFARDFGTTPHAYQLAMRVERSRNLIGGGTVLSEAAVEAGFYDQAHLSRHFRQVFGISPGRYASAENG